MSETLAPLELKHQEERSIFEASAAQVMAALEAELQNAIERKNLYLAQAQIVEDSITAIQTAIEKQRLLNEQFRTNLETRQNIEAGLQNS